MAMMKISQKEFLNHVEDKDFLIKYGNPVEILGTDGNRTICMSMQLYNWMNEEIDILSLRGRIRITMYTSDIRCSYNIQPGREKLQTYESYYIKEGKLPGVIVVDEDNELVDGHISYLLARKYGISQVPVMKIRKTEVFRKGIVARHVVDLDNALLGEKEYIWKYTGKQPILPGDYVMADTRFGEQLVKVTGLTELIGEEQMKKHKMVVRIVFSNYG